MIAAHRAEVAHLFRRVGAPTSEILTAESARGSGREVGRLPTRRALYRRKSGPKLCTEHMWGRAPPWSRLLGRTGASSGRPLVRNGNCRIGKNAPMSIHVHPLPTVCGGDQISRI